MPPTVKVNGTARFAPAMQGCSGLELLVFREFSDERGRGLNQNCAQGVVVTLYEALGAWARRISEARAIIVV